MPIMWKIRSLFRLLTDAINSHRKIMKREPSILQKNLELLFVVRQTADRTQLKV